MHARAIRCDDCKQPICPHCVQGHKKHLSSHNITELPKKLRCDQAAVSVPEKIDKQKSLSLSMPTKTRAEEVVRIQGKSNGDKAGQSSSETHDAAAAASGMPAAGALSRPQASSRAPPPTSSEGAPGGARSETRGDSAPGAETHTEEKCDGDDDDDDDELLLVRGPLMSEPSVDGAAGEDQKDGAKEAGAALLEKSVAHLETGQDGGRLRGKPEKSDEKEEQIEDMVAERDADASLVPGGQDSKKVSGESLDQDEEDEEDELTVTNAATNDCMEEGEEADTTDPLQMKNSLTMDSDGGGDDDDDDVKRENGRVVKRKRLRAVDSGDEESEGDEDQAGVDDKSNAEATSTGESDGSHSSDEDSGSESALSSNDADDYERDEGDGAEGAAAKKTQVQLVLERAKRMGCGVSKHKKRPRKDASAREGGDDGAGVDLVTMDVDGAGRRTIARDAESDSDDEDALLVLSTREHVPQPAVPNSTGLGGRGVHKHASGPLSGSVEMKSRERSRSEARSDGDLLKVAAKEDDQRKDLDAQKHDVAEGDKAGLVLAPLPLPPSQSDLSRAAAPPQPLLAAASAGSSSSMKDTSKQDIDASSHVTPATTKKRAAVTQPESKARTEVCAVVRSSVERGALSEEAVHQRRLARQALDAVGGISKPDPNKAANGAALTREEAAKVLKDEAMLHKTKEQLAASKKAAIRRTIRTAPGTEYWPGEDDEDGIQVCTEGRGLGGDE